MLYFGGVWRKITLRGTSFKKIPWLWMLTGILPVMLKIFWEHDETKSFYIKKKIRLALTAAVKNLWRNPHSPKCGFCSSSADLLKFQNSVYHWQESPGIALVDFQKSFRSFTFEEVWTTIDTQLGVIRPNGGLNPVERMQLSWVIPTINLRHFPKRSLRDHHCFQSWLAYLPK